MCFTVFSFFVSSTLPFFLLIIWKQVLKFSNLSTYRNLLYKTFRLNGWMDAIVDRKTSVDAILALQYSLTSLAGVLLSTYFFYRYVQPSDLLRHLNWCAVAFIGKSRCCVVVKELCIPVYAAACQNDVTPFEIYNRRYIKYITRYMGEGAICVTYFVCPLQ